MILHSLTVLQQLVSGSFVVLMKVLLLLHKIPEKKIFSGESSSLITLIVQDLLTCGSHVWKMSVVLMTEHTNYVMSFLSILKMQEILSMDLLLRQGLMTLVS